MEEKNETSAEQPKKFTYEQLSQIAGNLSNQVQQLSARLQEANMFNMFNFVIVNIIIKLIIACFIVHRIHTYKPFLSKV